MNQAPTETETKGGVWLSPEDYAALLEKDPVKRGVLLRRVKDMLHPNCTRTRETFAACHVKRLSSKIIRIYVTKPTVTGPGAPFIVKRKK